MIGEIGVKQMEYEIMTSNAPFYLVYITQSGERKVIERAIYGGQKRNIDDKKPKNQRKVVKLKENNRIPITNLDAPSGDAYREPRIALIIQFSNYRVRH
jgi:hypothetical protein